MSLAGSSVIGTIRIEPLAGQAERWVSDDSTLEQTLASYAHCGGLDSEPELRIIASTRLSRWAAGGEPARGVRANLAQLLDDLQSEYNELSSRLSD